MLSSIIESIQKPAYFYRAFEKKNSHATNNWKLINNRIEKKKKKDNVIGIAFISVFLEGRGSNCLQKSFVFTRFAIVHIIKWISYGKKINNWLRNFDINSLATLNIHTHIVTTPCLKELPFSISLTYEQFLIHNSLRKNKISFPLHQVILWLKRTFF